MQNTPFKYINDTVSTVAIYGSDQPVVFHGPLRLREYYKDAEQKNVDIGRTSAYIMDEIFFETNKVLREQMDDNYIGRRTLAYVQFKELGDEYILVYNQAEAPSPRFDDRLAILHNFDRQARGVTIVLKKTPTGVTWLGHEEAQDVSNKLVQYYD